MLRTGFGSPSLTHIDRFASLLAPKRENYCKVFHHFRIGYARAIRSGYLYHSHTIGNRRRTLRGGHFFIHKTLDQAGLEGIDILRGV